MMMMMTTPTPTPATTKSSSLAMMNCSNSQDDEEVSQDWKTVMMETFTSRGMLNELDDVTKYLLDMTQEYSPDKMNAQECDDEIMDLRHLLDDNDDDDHVDNTNNEEQEDMIPTPINRNRIHVVPTVVPSKDLLCASELSHLECWAQWLKVPLPSSQSCCISKKDAVSPEPSMVVSDTTSTSTPIMIDDSESSDSSIHTGDSSSSADGAANVVSWNYRFQELLDFRKIHGHVNVPYDYPPNPPLAQWVKRQRHQYRLLKEGRHSNLTQQRLDKLESIDYCWDSRQAHWLERYYELESYYKTNGHVRVSKRKTNDRPLAIWLKRQRRQGRLFMQGQTKGTNMTQERWNLLKDLDVQFTQV